MLIVLATGLLAGVLGSVAGAASVLVLNADARTHLVASSLAAPTHGTGNLDLQADSNINLTSRRPTRRYPSWRGGVREGKRMASHLKSDFARRSEAQRAAWRVVALFVLGAVALAAGGPTARFR